MKAGPIAPRWRHLHQLRLLSSDDLSSKEGGRPTRAVAEIGRRAAHDRPGDPMSIGSLALQAAGFLLYLWPVSLAILFLLLIGVVRGTGSPNAEWKRALLLAGSMLLFPGLILWLGCAWYIGEVPSPDPGWLSYSLFTLLLLQLASGVVAVIRSRGSRLLVGSLLAADLWYSVCCTFAANMLNWP
jgi:hypothetical protein